MDIESKYHELASDWGELRVYAAWPRLDGPVPVVVMYMDAMGPRPELFSIARQYASEGFGVLLPNLFGRLGSPVFPPPNQEIDQVCPDAVEANDKTTLADGLNDTKLLVEACDGGAFGFAAEFYTAIGYCMGGRYALSGVVDHPSITAGASAHGGRLVTSNHDSPHLLIERLEKPFRFYFAKDDVTCPEEHQSFIEDMCQRSPADVSCHRMSAHHGWSFPDRWCFDAEASSTVFRETVSLFREAGL